MTLSILERWEISAEDLTCIIDGNPSLRGMLLGYVAETKLRQVYFSQGKVNECLKPDDHDRSAKCDLVVTYHGEAFKVEVKSIQTNSIRRSEARITASFQCDASDRRQIVLPNGRRVTTTCLKTDDFDVVAVNLYAFENRWRFAFARNRDLPRTTHKGYTAYERKHLLASLVPITFPLEAPFRQEPFSLFDEIVEERNRKR